MPTTRGLLDMQLSPLTESEEQLFQRIVSRLEAYFADFEELEGFAVLSTNLHRLLRKVALELRCLCYEYHDTFLLIEVLRTRKEEKEQELVQQSNLYDQVIGQAEALLGRYRKAQQDHEQAIQRLHDYYQVQEEMLKKQWALANDQSVQDLRQALQREYEQRVALLDMQYQTRLDATKKQLEGKKYAELEYIQVQMRMQITSQVSRDLGKQLARQEMLCAKHLSEKKQLQSRLHALQATTKASQSY